MGKNGQFVSFGPFSPGFGLSDTLYKLIYSLSRALRVFSINNLSVSTQFPYGL